MHPVIDPPKRRRLTKTEPEIPESTQGEAMDREDLENQAAVRELLAILPPDVLGEIRSGDIDTGDPDFLSGLMDHASRLAIADPQKGRRILGKIIRLRKVLQRTVKATDPDRVVSTTVVGDSKRVGRNGICPCGSERKFKQCCMRKSLYS